MLIHEMTEDECRTALRCVNFGRLACARDNQPYVVPIYFSYDGQHLYGFSEPGQAYAFSTLGQKVEWMRSNPLVCLEIDERTSHNRWMSVVVFGRYEELVDTAEFGDQRGRAYTVLQERAMWWEPAYVATERREQSLTPIFYRIHIKRMTGRRATPDPVEAASSRAQSPMARGSWLGSILRHWNRATTFVALEPAVPLELDPPQLLQHVVGERLAADPRDSHVVASDGVIPRQSLVDGVLDAAGRHEQSER